MTPDSSQFFKEEEVAALIDIIHSKYGYDFSNYSESSLMRRIDRIMLNYNIPTFAELRYKIMNDEIFFNSFIEELTVNVTEMFRDPDFFKAIREEVLPILSRYTSIRLWHAGCSSGEEVYSTAILLKEAGLLEKSLIYATDISQKVIEQASGGKYSDDQIKVYAANYIAAGGQHDFSDYYITKNGHAEFNTELRKKMVFSSHNLAIDQSFNEFNLIMCRNVMIYFNRTLQNKVMNLLNNSLSPSGFLALGTKETINFSSIANDFEEVNKKQRIWKKNE